jgi:MFS family permease
MNRAFFGFSGLTGLWRNPDFMKLWAGQTVSEFGSRITRDALPLVAVITLAATPTQMAILTAISSLPVLLFGLAAGVIVDRVRRRPIMIAADLTRLILLLSIPAAAVTGTLRIELLYLVAAVTGLLALVFEVAYRAVLPTLLPRRDLLEGNTKLATTDSLAEIGGPAIAGLLVQWISAPLAVIFDALSYLVSAVSFSLIRAPEPPPEPSANDQNAWRDMLDGWRFLLSDPLLRPLLLRGAMAGFFGNFIGPLYALFAVRTLGLSPAQLGFVIASGGIGALMGALLADRLPRRFPLNVTLIGSLAVGSALHLLIPLAGGSVIVAMLMLIVGQIAGDAAMTVYHINELSLRQAITPDRMLGRVNASIGFLVGGVAPLGALVGGTLADVTSPRAMLFVAAFGIMLAAGWVIVSPVRRLHTHPQIAAHLPEAL